MVLNFLIQVVLCSISMFIAQMMFYYFFIARWKAPIVNIGLQILCVIAGGTVLASVNQLGIFWLNIVTSVNIHFILGTAFYKGKIISHIFFSIITTTFASFFEVLVIMPASWIFGENLTQVVAKPANRIALTIICHILNFIVVRVLFVVLKGRKYNKTGIESLFLFSLPIVTIANIILMVKLEFYAPPSSSQKVIMILVCLGLIACNIAVFFIYDKNLRKYELENRLRETAKIQRIQTTYYKQIELGLNNSRKQMHDFKNHITILERLYQTGCKDRALTYMNELQAKMNEDMSIASFKVNNTAFDVILYEQERVCAEHGITFEKQILYNDLSILKYIDTCTIFANALENAVKACNEVIESEKKISLMILRANDMISITMENSKQNEIIKEQSKIVSTKADKSNHGFGIENIKRAVDKYNGLVSIEHTNNKFVLAIGIPVPEQ